ncbi:MAG: hypothetical protein JW722_04855 [Demequinaceae bacterium]|nr:hypothetical protein [Demequinaceae bacterium]
MLHVRHAMSTKYRRRAGVRLAAVGALVAVVALAGCSSGTPPKVTVTVPPPAVTASPGAGPADPGDPGGPINPDGVVLIASQGGVASECTNSTCWYPHIIWDGLEKGSHQVQCVTDDLTPNVWSDNSYYFDAASGERELKCFLGHPGSEVWVVIDGIYESNHVDWG